MNALLAKLKALIARARAFPPGPITLTAEQGFQASHFFLGALLTTAPSARWGSSLVTVIAGNCISIGFAAFKEFWFDPRKESPLTRGSDLRDFLFYCAGVLAGDLWMLV